MLELRAGAKNGVGQMIRKLLVSATVSGALCGAILGLAPSLALADVPPGTVSVSYSAQATEKFEETYGNREKAELEATLERRLQPLTSQGMRVDVEIVDAQANRPTMQELSDRVGLSYSSFGVGGASFRATVFNSAGTQVAQTDYEWYETSILDSAYESTWGDAETAINRFARRLVREVGVN
jgi:hypothetical protein